ncbi:MAG: glycosyltransferase [Bacteroidota bacterium]|nr:glycosyltransferase [Bacteroidota bacterium]
MRILILYTELADYVVNNFNVFLSQNPDAKMLVIHYPVNSEAPFVFKKVTNANFLVFQSDNWSTTLDTIHQFNPNIILCSGWSNKHYLNLIKSIPNTTKRVLCFDNQWQGTIKQKILSTFSKWSFLKYFNMAWVAGEPQKEYALRLGFKEANIFRGLYPANEAVFSPIGKEKLENNQAFPKILISIARYIPQKDLPTLWKAFIKVNQSLGNTWKLYSFGQGELFNQRIENDYITHFGFVQPEQMKPYLLESGVYVLPSMYEPWGVAVHEMALCAMPLVLSDKVGAATQFLTHQNGYSFKAGNALDLEQKLSLIMNLSDEALWNMASYSYKLASSSSPSIWSETLLKIFKS